jgi:hypothetical protein
MVATVIISAVIFGAITLVIVNTVKKIKKGESGCGCGCSGCSQADKCHR